MHPPPDPRYNATDIRQRDDGLFQIGDDNGPGPFETREFALSVAGYMPAVPAPASPFRKIKMKEARRRARST
jgi:hypothetical protein